MFFLIIDLFIRAKATSCIACSMSKKTCQWDGVRSALKRRVGQKAEPIEVELVSKDEEEGKRRKQGKSVWQRLEGQRRRRQYEKWGRS